MNFLKIYDSNPSYNFCLTKRTMDVEKLRWSHVRFLNLSGTYETECTSLKLIGATVETDVLSLDGEFL